MRHSSVCPYCHDDCATTALTELIHTFETDIESNELIETTWHRNCFLASCQPTPEAEQSYARGQPKAKP